MTAIRGLAPAPVDVAAGAICCGTLAVAGLGAGAGFDADGPILCPFAVTTGVPCPLCGMTRSIAALGRGDLSASLGLHPLGVVALPLAAVVLAVILRALAGGRRVRWRPELLLAGAAVVLAAWLGTLTIGEPPPL